jgi:hypothetical protein
VYPVSDRFLARIAEGYGYTTSVQLFTSDGQVLDLPHTGGSVVVDRSQSIRRTCTVTGADTSLIPVTAADQLSTYGARLRISVGVDYDDGTAPELVPQGVFRLDEAGGDPTLGPVTLTGKDLSVIVDDDLFTTPYTATGTVVSAITALVTRSIPDAGIVSTITDIAIGARTWNVGDSPWAAAQEIAAAAGAELYVDGDGVFRLAVLPDVLSTMPAWTIAAGEGGVYVSGTRRMSAAGVRNGVLAMGEDAGTGAAPVSALVTDDDPGSPTRWGGPFGRRPLIYASSTLTTTSACTAAARQQLAAARAPNATGDLSSLPNAALQEGDVLRVIHPDGLAELHQTAAFTVPLDLGGDFPISTISAKEDA